jgi:hypothetical protein
MATVSYETACPSCGEMVTAEISVQPEQQGGPETEYLAEYWGLSADLECIDCDYEFNADEVKAVLLAACNHFGR